MTWCNGLESGVTLVALHGRLQRIVTPEVTDHARVEATDGVRYLDFLGMTELPQVCHESGIRLIAPTPRRSHDWSRSDYDALEELVTDELAKSPVVLAGFSDGATHALGCTLDRGLKIAGLVFHSGFEPRVFRRGDWEWPRCPKLWVVTDQQWDSASKGTKKMAEYDGDESEDSRFFVQKDGRFDRGVTPGHWWSPNTSRLVVAFACQVAGRTVA